ncbi:MAG: glycosyltransferase [Actinomycetota bacterium]
MERDGTPAIFVTVGTDHHPFARLIEWVDTWLEAGGGERARCFVQSGTSPRPRHAEAADYLAYEEMERLMSGATVIVSHGGPGSIMQAAALGKRPIVIPRRHRLGEHVDDHQVAFARRLAAEGTIELAESEDRLHDVLDLGASGALATGRRRDGEAVIEAVRRFEALVSALPFHRRTEDARDPRS